MLKWYEWIYCLLCVAFCIFAFVDKEYMLGTIFTVLTVIGTVNSFRSNLKDRKKK